MSDVALVSRAQCAQNDMRNALDFVEERTAMGRSRRHMAMSTRRGEMRSSALLFWYNDSRT